MSEEFDTKLMQSNSDEKVVRLTEGEYTIDWKFSRIGLKVLTLSLVLCLGFFLSELSYSVRHKK